VNNQEEQPNNQTSNQLIELNNSHFGKDSPDDLESAAKKFGITKIIDNNNIL